VKAFLVLIAALAVVSCALAAASTVDKVQVGVSGRNATAGLSPALFIDVAVVQDYTQAKFDGEQGDWTGPAYTATQKPGTGVTDLSFRSIFDNAVGSLAAMVQKALVQKTWTQAQSSAVRVPRVLAGRTVGTIAGAMALYEEPIGGSARWESVVALPLCHNVFGAVDFYADAPPQDTSGTAGQYQVGTTPAKQWNEDHALASIKGVALDGPLPGAHVTARASGKRLTGVVGDCGGGLQGVPLVVQRAGSAAGRGVSGAGGTFSLPAHGAGRYRVLAALGPFKAASATVTVH
jgi:hypothetical protein